MDNKTLVKCKYYDTYAWSKPPIRGKGRTIIGEHFESYDKVIVGAFTHVVWDGEERTLELKDGRKKVRVEECDYQLGEDYFAEKKHIGTHIEYLAIDDFVVIDDREENCGEMNGAVI